MQVPRKVYVLAAVALVACSPAVPNVTVKTGNTLESVPDAATIVVVQPRTKYRSVSFVDGAGRLLGQLDMRSHTLLRVPPGDVRLYAFWENKTTAADRIVGTVLPGKIYFATVSYRGTVGGIALLALNPRSPDRRWEEKDKYLSSTPRVQLDPARAAEVMQRIGAAPEIFRWADEHTKGLTGRPHDERVILPGDGI